MKKVIGLVKYITNNIYSGQIYVSNLYSNYEYVVKYNIFISF